MSDLTPLEALKKSQQLNSKTASDPLAKSKKTPSYIGDFGLKPIDTAPNIEFLSPDFEHSQYDEGYNSDLSLQDYRARNQSGTGQMMRAIPRIAGGTILKGLEGAALLASGIGAGVANLGIMGARNLMDSNAEYLDFDDVTNNPIVNSLVKMEEGMKDYFKI